MDKQIIFDLPLSSKGKHHKPTKTYDIDDIVQVNLAGKGSLICEVVGIHVVKYKGVLYDLSIYENQIQFGIENIFCSGLKKGTPSRVEGFIMNDIEAKFIEPYIIQYVDGKDVNSLKQEWRERDLKYKEYKLEEIKKNIEDYGK